jgi:anaerobic dimethyl sulfoxide reductase subunit B (iron-sulfur subunit)
MPGQYGFFFDADRCIMCHACELACKGTRGLEPGVQWRQVVEIWQGEFPAVTRTFVSLSCLHCAEPPCREACPTGAISKRAEDGIVVVDAAKCTGCQECYPACPYGVPQFGTDGTMQKCDFCLERGIAPACTSPCPTDALLSGTMDELAGIAAAKAGAPLPGAAGPSMLVSNTRGPDLPVGSLVVRPRGEATVLAVGVPATEDSPGAWRRAGQARRS